MRWEKESCFVTSMFKKLDENDDDSDDDDDDDNKVQ